jgi:hypothetical protein
MARAPKIPPGPEAAAEPASAAPAAADAGDTVSAVPSADGSVELAVGFTELGPLVVTITARVARRRAGRSWQPGDVVTLAPEELAHGQLNQLLADPGFELDFHPAG